MTEYMFKIIDMMNKLLVIRVNYKKRFFNNYSKKPFCQYFNFQPNQDSFSVKHIKFEKQEAPKK